MRVSSLNVSLCILALMVTGYSANASGTVKGRVRDKTVIARQFYSQQGSPLFWYDTSNPASAMLRKTILRIADSAKYYALDKGMYHFPDSNNNGISFKDLIKKDQQFTNALLELAFDIYEGANIDHYINSDELSGKYAPTADSIVSAWLNGICRQTDVTGYIRKLEPKDSTYHTLKTELQKQITSGNGAKIKKLVACINMQRWIRHFNYSRYIIVNIPETMLTVYEKEHPILSMKVVAGKPSTRTPRLSTWCNKVILYPYWNVPASIAHKELLPLFRRSPVQVRKMNMQIIGKNGKQVDPYNLDWTSFNSEYFPYIIRQCTGCDNALGVIKFNLTDPFDVYMHDTNFKPAFASSARYLSHGCIRLEKPLDLGNYLLDGKLDSNFLKACIKGQEPVAITVDAPIPVFVVYMPVAVVNDDLIYLKDIYHLY